MIKIKIYTNWFNNITIFLHMLLCPGNTGPNSIALFSYARNMSKVKTQIYC